MIAKELKKSGINIHFGAGSDAIALMKREGLAFSEIPEFPKEIYDKKMKHNNFFVYTRKIIETFVRAEIELYDKIKPDLIVYDSRYTARISAEIKGVKTVSITNANLTPYYDFNQVKFPLDTILVKFLPDRLLTLINQKYGQDLLRKLGPRLIQTLLIIEMIRMSPSLLKLGYKIRKDPYQLLLGNTTLLTDIPEYRPVLPLPQNIEMIGPVFWDGGSKLPKGALKLKDRKNIIYVSAGGTGDKKMFIKLLIYLKDSGNFVVATTGNTLNPKDVNLRYDNLFLTDYLPGDYILPKAKLIIFPGGNATCYQALSYGVPQILTPLHVDQEDNANQLVRLGTGIMINPYIDLNKKNLLVNLEKLSSNRMYKENSEKLSKILKMYNGPVKAAEIIGKLLN